MAFTPIIFDTTSKQVQSSMKEIGLAPEKLEEFLDEKPENAKAAFMLLADPEDVVKLILEETKYGTSTLEVIRPQKN